MHPNETFPTRRNQSGCRVPHDGRRPESDIPRRPAKGNHAAEMGVSERRAVPPRTASVQLQAGVQLHMLRGKYAAGMVLNELVPLFGTV
jgi:hypothetical protein